MAESSQLRQINSCEHLPIIQELLDAMSCPARFVTSPGSLVKHFAVK